MENLEWTAIARRALNILVVSHPRRTSAGLLCGVTVDTIIKMFAPFLESLKFVDLTRPQIWQYMLSGAFLFHVVPGVFQNNILDEDTERDLAELQKVVADGKLTRAQTRMLYLEYIHQKVGVAKG